MELWDVYDKFRHKIDKTHERGNPMQTGEYHFVTHVWIVNDNGEYLIQKRQPWKKGWPNMWDSSAAGAAQAGDDSVTAAIRETKEEIGVQINSDGMEHLFTVKFLNGFDDVWLVRENINISELKLQYEEVADAKWVTEEEIRQMVAKGEFIEVRYLDRLFEMTNSKLSLRKADVNDAEELLALQRRVFKKIYETYQDHETSPVKQTKEKFLRRFEIGDYYKIIYQNTLAGSVFVYEKEPGKMVFHIINILEEYQNNGIAQETMKRLEGMYPQAESWQLETILTEKRNCYLYEKMGYVKSGEIKIINDKMTLVNYVKQQNLNKI
jgi:isopentenyldiphosphate isomerase